MAHLAQLGALADDLVAAIAGIPEVRFLFDFLRF